MFHQLLIIFACSLVLTTAQYHQPQYQLAQYQQQQPQYQQQYQQQAQYQQQPAPAPTAAQYPAGVDAQLCPNYPDCSNPLLAVQAVARASDPRYQAQQAPRPKSQYSPDIQQRLDRGEYIGDGDYHGEGLDEALAPEAAVGSRYTGQTPEAQYTAAQFTPQPTAGAVHYPAQQAASQYSAQPASVQYPAQRAASQYAAQPGLLSYPAQRAASTYTTSPQYITAPQPARSPQYYPAAAGTQYPQASLFRPQYAVRESRSHGLAASGSEPVPTVQLPAGIDASACPNYPFCHS